MADVILDASAILAFLHGEPGGDAVAQHVPGASMSAVNVSEVVATLAAHGFSETEVRTTIGRLGLDVLPFDLDDAIATGMLRPETKALGLSMADRACLAAARTRGWPAITADRVWAGLDIGVDVKLVR